MTARRHSRRTAEAPKREPRTLAELNCMISAAGPLVAGEGRAVLGEGPQSATIAFVGEQPGDQEDLQGRPFVGPAGQLLRRAMAEAGIDERHVYLTNAVKHFKYEKRGKRRIHQKPTLSEIRHYRWWLEKELRLVGPQVVVALGATAVVALAGKSRPVLQSRGEAQLGEFSGFITVHPSYVLRLRDEEEKQRAYDSFVADLKAVRALAARHGSTGAAA